MEISLSKQRSTDWFSILLLACTAMVFVTAELLPVGILGEISRSFSAPVGKVGLMVTGYAWTVALSAVLITSFLGSFERRTLLIGITLLFAVANVLVACAPSLTMLFIARVVGAFGHGVFWSMVGPICIRLSGNASKARATSVVFGGIAVAAVIAVPGGTLLSQFVGWRYAFGMIALASLLLMVAIVWRFPKLPSNTKGSLKQLPQLLRHPLMRRLCPSTALALTGHFCAFTYVSLLLEKGVRITPDHLAFYLFLPEAFACIAISIACSRFIANGFSQRTCFPFANASKHIS